MGAQRAGNWQLVFPSGAGDDPVPGDLAAITEYADRVKSIGTAMETADTSMRGIIADSLGFDSDAVSQFVKNSSEFGDGLKRAYGRYDDTARALEDYRSALEVPQRTTAGLLSEAEENRAEYGRVQGELADARSRASAVASDVNSLAMQVNGVAGSDDPDDIARGKDLTNQYNSAQNTLSSANAEVTRLEDRLATLDEELDTIRASTMAQALLAGIAGGAAAAAAILAAINDEVTDQGIDWLVNTLNLEAVGEILSNVTAVLGVIAFIVSFIPGLNVLAPLLFALTFVLGALSLATNSLLAMNGNKDWGDAIMDAVGLATFGLGRVITVIGRGAAAMGRAGTSAVRGGAGAVKGGGAAIW